MQQLIQRKWVNVWFAIQECNARAPEIRAFWVWVAWLQHESFAGDASIAIDNFTTNTMSKRKLVTKANPGKTAGPKHYNKSILLKNVKEKIPSNPKEWDEVKVLYANATGGQSKTSDKLLPDLEQQRKQAYRQERRCKTVSTKITKKNEMQALGLEDSDEEEQEEEEHEDTFVLAAEEEDEDDDEEVVEEKPPKKKT